MTPQQRVAAATRQAYRVSALTRVNGQLIGRTNTPATRRAWGRVVGAEAAVRGIMFTGTTRRSLAGTPRAG